MRKFDWTKLTKGRGDSGETTSLFGIKIKKSDPSLRALNALENAHVGYGKMLANLKLAVGDSNIVLLDLDHWFLDLGAYLSCRSASERKKLDSMKLYKRSNLELLGDIEKALLVLGEHANELGIPGDWVCYGEVGLATHTSVIGFAIFEFTSLIRTLETEFFTLVHTNELGLMDTEESVQELGAILNRLSKLFYLYGRIFVFEGRNNFEQNENT